MWTESKLTVAAAVVVAGAFCVWAPRAAAHGMFTDLGDTAADSAAGQPGEDIPKAGVPEARPDRSEGSRGMAKTNWWFYKVRATCSVENGKAVGLITNNGSGPLKGTGKVRFHFYDADYQPAGISSKGADIALSPGEHFRAEYVNMPDNIRHCALDISGALTPPERDFWTTNNTCVINDGVATGAIFNTTASDIHYRGQLEVTYYDRNSVYVKRETVSGRGVIPAGKAEVYRLGMIPGTAAYCVLNPSISEFSFVKAARTGRKTVSLRAADGTEITVEYEPSRGGDEIRAESVRLRVRNAGLRGAEKVRAVLMNYFDGQVAAGMKDSQTIDLAFDGAAFTGKAAPLTLMQPEMNFRQELAVVVDGRWLTDPVGGGHNFRFKLAW